MRKTINITFRLLFAPHTFIKNKVARRVFRVLLFAATLKRYMDAYNKAQRRAELEVISRRVLNNRDQLHMLYVDYAIANDRITEGEADAEWCRAHGIEL